MSAVDTSMYDPLIQQPKPEGPMDMLEKATALKTAMGRAQMQPLEMEQTRLENENLRNKAQTTAEDMADSKVLQQIYGEVQLDSKIPPEKKLAEIRTRAAGKVKPRTIEALSKQVQEHEDAVSKLHDQQLKEAESLSKEIGNTAAGILGVDPKDQPALYAQERARLIKSGHATEDDIPEQFDPNWLKMAQVHAMGAANAATAEIQSREQKNKDAEASRKQRSEDLANAGQTIDSVKSQEEYDTWRKALPDNVKSYTAATWSPANVATIKRLGLSATQQNEADEETRRANETALHDRNMEKKTGADSKSYTGQMRAALVAAGAADPDNPTKEQAAAALDKIKSPTAKAVPKATLIQIESRKSKAIADSKKQLDKELLPLTVNGKVLDQAAVDKAWEDHIERVQGAQTGYENELTTATGEDVGHNDWADRLTAPGKGGKAPASTPGKPAAAAPADHAAKQQKAVSLVPKYHNDQIVTVGGKKVRITNLDPKTGNFTPEPVTEPAQK